MHRILPLIVALMAMASPISASASSVDEQINSVMTPLTNAIMKVIFFEVSLGSLTIPFVLIWLLAGAIFFTFYFNFLNIRGFGHALDVVRGKYDDPNDAGEVSHFQALTAALSGTVGVGNIAGVAFAVSLGGPGATFWMIVAGLLGMSSKFVECTLGTKYRKENPDGSVSGGPMYYLRDGLAKQGKAGLGKVLAVLFAIACIGGSFGGGNMVQINQATKQLIEVTGGEASFLAGQSWMFGAAMAVIVGLIIIGGHQKHRTRHGQGGSVHGWDLRFGCVGSPGRKHHRNPFCIRADHFECIFFGCGLWWIGRSLDRGFSTSSFLQRGGHWFRVHCTCCGEDQ
jgi:alanine or glycine:cation symporter, AGCS family